MQYKFHGTWLSTSDRSGRQPVFGVPLCRSTNNPFPTFLFRGSKLSKGKAAGMTAKH